MKKAKGNRAVQINRHYDISACQVVVKSSSAEIVVHKRRRYKLRFSVAWKLNLQLDFYEAEHTSTNSAIQIHDMLLLAPCLIVRKDGDVTVDEIRKGLLEKIFEYGQQQEQEQLRGERGEEEEASRAGAEDDEVAAERKRVRRSRER